MAGRIEAAPGEERFADEARFFKAWFENPLRTGAVSPSGRFLARMMARYVDPDSDGPIIELGPGTGPVTQALLQRGVAPERLVLVEYDPAFCRLLSRRFPRCRVVQGDAYDLPRTLADLAAGSVASVVSSLPLLTCAEPRRLDLLEQAFNLMAPEGNFIQFTYGMVSPVPLRSRDGVPHDFAAEASPPVWLNLPPARVWVYRRACETVAARPTAGEAFMGKIRQRTVKARDELRETRDKVENKLRARAAKVRVELAAKTKKVRNDRNLKPALALLKKMSDHGKRVN